MKVTLKGICTTVQPDPSNPAIRRFLTYLAPFEVSKLCYGMVNWPNPRVANPSKPSGKRILKSLRDTPKSFHQKNQGITLLASNVTQSGDTLIITFSDSPWDGLINGGTTQQVVSQNIDADILVPLEVLAGRFPESSALEINLARNGSAAMDLASILHKQGLFGWLKGALHGVPVRYFDGDLRGHSGSKPLHVGAVVQMLALFVATKQDGSWHPTKAYTGRDSCLKMFSAEVEAFLPYEDLLRDILALHEYIQAETPGLVPYFQKSHVGRPGLTKSGKLKVPGKQVLPVTGKTIFYEPQQAWVFPMLGAFRANVDTSTGKARWIANPTALYTRLADGMFSEIEKVLQQHGENYNALGRTPSIYQTLHDIVADGVSKTSGLGFVAAAGK